MLNAFTEPSRTQLRELQLADIACVSVSGEYSLWYSEGDLRTAAGTGLQFVLDGGAVARHTKAAAEACNAYLELASQYTPDRIERFGPHELATQLATLFARFRTVQMYYQISSPAFTAAAEERLRSEISSRPSDQENLVAMLVSGDHRELKTYKEGLDWWELVAYAQQQHLSGDKLEQLVERHHKTYVFVGADSIEHQTAERFHQRLAVDMRLDPSEVGAKLAAADERTRVLLATRESALQIARLSPSTRVIADALAELGVHRLAMREAFTEAAFKSYALFQSVFRRYQERIGPLSDDLLRQLSMEEVLLIAAGQHVPREAVLDRFDCGFWRVRDGVLTSAVAEEARHLVVDLGIQGAQPSVEKRPDVTGVVGSAGPTVTAEAVVIDPGLSLSDQGRQALAAMKPGHVLVTGMTMVNLVSFCAQAGAIVTDYGGLTAHAVVISREFGIPCIVATQIATQVIHTGDVVEVDTGSATVRILQCTHLE